MKQTFIIAALIATGCISDHKSEQSANPCLIAEKIGESSTSVAVIPPANDVFVFKCKYTFRYEDGSVKEFVDIVDSTCSRSKYDRLGKGSIDTSCSK
jgi:hypothetical protein